MRSSSDHPTLRERGANYTLTSMRRRPAGAAGGRLARLRLRPGAPSAPAAARNPRRRHGPGVHQARGGPAPPARPRAAGRDARRQFSDPRPRLSRPWARRRAASRPPRSLWIAGVDRLLEGTTRLPEPAAGGRSGSRCRPIGPLSATTRPWRTSARPPLPPDTEIVWNQALLDVAASTIQSAPSVPGSAIEPAFAQTRAARHDRRCDSFRPRARVRAFEFGGDPGLDPARSTLAPVGAPLRASRVLPHSRRRSTICSSCCASSSRSAASDRSCSSSPRSRSRTRSRSSVRPSASRRTRSGFLRWSKR